jgi:fumarate reductase subunit D
VRAIFVAGRSPLGKPSMRPEDQLKGQTIQPVGQTTETVREQDKLQLVLAYLALLALFPLLTVKDSEYVQWHAKNGLVLGVGGAIAIAVLGAIPILQILACVAVPLLVIVDIVAMVKALAGTRWRIPVVSDLAEKF